MKTKTPEQLQEMRVLVSQELDRLQAITDGGADLPKNVELAKRHLKLINDEIESRV